MAPQVSTSVDASPDPPTADDYSMLQTLCEVWPYGPDAQAYRLTKDLSYAPLAAREIRKAIEASDMARTELGQDHIELLKRIEHGTQDKC